MAANWEKWTPRDNYIREVNIGPVGSAYVRPAVQYKAHWSNMRTNAKKTDKMTRVTGDPPNLNYYILRITSYCTVFMPL